MLSSTTGRPVPRGWPKKNPILFRWIDPSPNSVRYLSGDGSSRAVNMKSLWGHHECALSQVDIHTDILWGCKTKTHRQTIHSVCLETHWTAAHNINSQHCPQTRWLSVWDQCPSASLLSCLFLIMFGLHRIWTSSACRSKRCQRWQLYSVAALSCWSFIVLPHANAILKMVWPDMLLPKIDSILWHRMRTVAI